MVHHFRGLMDSAQYNVPFSRGSNVPLLVPASIQCSRSNCECVGGK